MARLRSWSATAGRLRSPAPGPARGLPRIRNNREGISAGTLPQSLVTSASPSLVGGRGRIGIDAEQRPDLHFPVPPMPARRPDAADPAGCGPPGNSLGINAEEGCDLSGSKQAITLPVHLRLLARLDPPRSIFILITKDHNSPQIPQKFYSQPCRTALTDTCR